MLQQPPGAWITFTETGTDAVHWDSIAIVDVFVQGIASVSVVPQTVLAGNPATLTASLMMPENPAPPAFEWVIISAPEEPDLWIDDAGTLTTLFFAWTPGYYTLEARVHPDYEMHELLDPATYRLTILVEWISVEFDRYYTQQWQSIPITISLLPPQARYLRVEILDAFAEAETVVWTQWHWTDSNGVLPLNLFGDLAPGEYRLRITDLTDPDHVQIITDEWVTVLSGNNISVTVTPHNIAIGESAEAKVMIAFGEVDPNTGIPARGLPGREVTVTVTEFMYNTGTYSGVTDSEGIARIPVGYDLQPGWLTVFATDELTGATSASTQLTIVTMESMRISAPELSTETIAYRQQPPSNPLRVRASEELLLQATSLWGMPFPDAVPTRSCDPPAAGTFTFNAGLETAFYVADPMWRGTLTITARVGSETLTAQVVYVGVHHVESSSPTAREGDTVVFTAYPDPQNESFPLDGTSASALEWTSEPDLGTPTVTVYADRVEASYIIPAGVGSSGGGGDDGGRLTFVDATATAVVPANTAFNFGSGDFTAVTFFRSIVPPPDHHVLLSHQAAPHSDVNLYFDINGADVRVVLSDLETLWVNLPSGSNPFNGAWHSVSVVRSDGMVSVYYDGIDCGGGSRPATGDHTAELTFGHLHGGNHAQTLIGSLKNYSYWHRALSEFEVAVLHAAGGQLQGNEPGLVGYWPMDDGSGAALREVVAGRDAVLSGNYQWQSGGAENSLVKVTATSGASKGDAFVLVVGDQWVITPQPAVVGQGDVLMMTATQEGVTGMGAWMTKADFELFLEIVQSVVSSQAMVPTQRLWSAMFDGPYFDLTSPPLVAELVTEAMPLWRVTVTDWNWMEAVEEVIINGQTVDTSGWGSEEWEMLFAQPHAQELVLIVTQAQQVAAQRTIRTVISDVGTNWQGVNTGSVDVVFLPLPMVAQVFESVSSPVTWEGESGVQGSCVTTTEFPEFPIAEATLWVTNARSILVKDWVTGETAICFYDADGNLEIEATLISEIGRTLTLQASIYPPDAPRWPINDPIWSVRNIEEPSEIFFAYGNSLVQFGPFGEFGTYRFYLRNDKLQIGPVASVDGWRIESYVIDPQRDPCVDARNQLANPLGFKVTFQPAAGVCGGQIVLYQIISHDKPWTVVKGSPHVDASVPTGACKLPPAHGTEGGMCSNAPNSYYDSPTDPADRIGEFFITAVAVCRTGCSDVLISTAYFSFNAKTRTLKANRDPYDRQHYKNG